MYDEAANRIKLPPWFQPYHEWWLTARRRRNFHGWVCGTAMFALLVAAIALIVAAVALGQVQDVRTAATYAASQPLPAFPFTHIITATGGPITLTLPNDLSDYVGHWITVASDTGQAHQVVIQAGLLPTAWDPGNNKVATFGGAPGDYLTFFVVGKSQINLGPLSNVVFS